MELTGEHRINAPRAVVWAGLNDPDTLKQSIDGIEEITRVSDTELDALAVVKVGPVKAKFKGKITLSDLDPPNGYTITGEGQGGVAGFAKGSAKVRLEEDGGGTLLKYNVTAQIGGKLAQIGSRLVDAAAKKIADDFFRNFNEKVSAHGDPDATVVPANHGDEDKPAAEPGDKQLPGVSDTTLAFFAAGALLVVLTSLITLLN